MVRETLLRVFMSDEKDDLLFLILLILVTVVSWCAYHEGKESMVNELCNIKVYDFCQQADTTYKLKEFKE
jgi:hypothetical protein